MASSAYIFSLFAWEASGLLFSLSTIYMDLWMVLYTDIIIMPLNQKIL
jgi:hypothetical protein